MQLSLTPILLATELGFVFGLAWRTSRRASVENRIAPVYIYLSWLTVYATVTSVLGAYGVYTTDALLGWLPGFWLQLITVAACVAPVIGVERVRQGLRQIVDATPWTWFATFHGLRIAALGTIVKTMAGEFPTYFAILVGIPDFLFGLSAFWMAAKARHGGVSERGFMVWNLIGAFIIVPSAPVLLQLGLPSPVQVFTSLPDARAVFTYPMSIAPMMGVPFFVLVNLWVAWRLWERRQVTAELVS